MAWATWLGRDSESRSGAWDGLSVRLPDSYYATRPFEKGGRVYHYLGVRLVPASATSVLWAVNPALLRSQRGARQTMMRTTHDPEAGHLRHIRGDRRYHVVGAGLRLVGHRGMAAAVQSSAQRYPVLSVRQVRARPATGRIAHRRNVSSRPCRERKDHSGKRYLRCQQTEAQAVRGVSRRAREKVVIGCGPYEANWQASARPSRPRRFRYRTSIHKGFFNGAESDSRSHSPSGRMRHITNDHFDEETFFRSEDPAVGGIRMAGWGLYCQTTGPTAYAGGIDCRMRRDEASPGASCSCMAPSSLSGPWASGGNEEPYCSC